MVSFEKDAFTVKVYTGMDSSGTWVNTCRDIIDVLADVDTSSRCDNNYYYLLQLLKEMLPDEEAVQKMMPR